MCTLIAGIGVLGPGTLVVGANRDEAPERPSSGPALLRERPRVVGGRDLAAGGTWMAVRESRFVTALMNRRPLPDTGDPPRIEGRPLRSRGLLCLDAAAAPPAADAPHAIDPGTGERYPARRDAALRLVTRDAYAHCTLIGLGIDGEAWAIHAGHGGPARASALPPGWHVVTHADPDDPSEPRTRWLLQALHGFEPADAGEALDRLRALLGAHGDAENDRGARDDRDAKDDRDAEAPPAVCLHRARFPTVSSALLALGNVGAPRYLHAPGPPCVTPYEDVSALLG